VVPVEVVPVEVVPVEVVPVEVVPVEVVPVQPTLSLGAPVMDDDTTDVFPSPPQLRRSTPRRTWNWNDDTDSDDE